MASHTGHGRDAGSGTTRGRARFDAYMGDSDGIMWTIERDPELRSTIVVVFLLDRAPDWARLLERADQTTRLVPRLRQRVVETPGRLAPPRWVVDDDFDLAFHVRRYDAPSPRDVRTVLDVAEVMAEAAFDPERPLWELALLERVEGDRAAAVIKIHHAVTDGVGGMQLLGLLLDTERYPARTRGRVAPPAPEHPVLPALAAEGLARSGRQTVAAVRGAVTGVGRAAGDAARHPVRSGREAVALARSVVRVLAPATRTMSPLMRHRSLRRRVDAFDVPLADLHRAAHVAGGTVNDPFVAALAGGLHRYHDKHEAPVEALRVTMPISTRTDADPLGGNRIMPARFALPVAVADPAERIRRIGQVCHEWQHEPALPLTDALATVLDRLPGPVTTAVFGSMLKHVDFLATNVPGSPIPLYLVGARIDRMWAFAPTMGAALNVALVSYAGRAGIGISVDTGAVTDPEVLVGCLREGFDEVLALAADDSGGSGPGPGDTTSDG